MLHRLRTSLAVRLLTPLLAWACGAALAGCGQKGPLTLPATTGAPVAAASAPAR